MNDYKKHFDELGQLRSGDYNPWSTVDRVILAIFAMTVVLIGLI